MGIKGRILVLARLRAGDSDIIARVYGASGVATLLVREGLVPGHRFHGIFEPFNTMVLDYRQRGEIILPQDFSDLQPLSLLSRDCDRFLWMSSVCEFILKKVRFYDPALFETFIGFLTRDPKGKEHLLSLLLRLSYIKFSGITPKFLGETPPRGRVRIRLSEGSISEDGEVEVSAGTLKLIQSLVREESLPRVRSGIALYIEGINLLDALINYHTR